MKLSYDVTDAELTQGVRLQAQVLRSASIMSAGLLAILLSIDGYFLHSGEYPAASLTSHIVESAAIAIGIGFLMFLSLRFISIPARCRRARRLNPFFFRDLSIEVDESGFEIKSEHNTTHWKWAELAGYREGSRIFLLCPTKRLGYVVPKRSMSATDAVEFARIIKASLKDLA